MKRIIVERKGLGTTAIVRQENKTFISKVVIEEPTLLFVNKGIKTVSNGNQKLVIKSGEAIGIASGLQFDVTNTPIGGLYEATVISFDQNLINGMDVNLQKCSSIEPAFAFTQVKSGFVESFALATKVIHNSAKLSETIARHRMIEIFYWLAEYGKRFQIRKKVSYSQEIRQMVRKDLALHQKTFANKISERIGTRT